MTNVKCKIRKNDTVIVIAGDDKGKIGVVSKVFLRKMKALVEGVNIVQIHKKATANSESGIVKRPAPVHISNLAHVDPKLDVKTKIGYKILEDGKKVRYAKKSGELILSGVVDA